MSPVNDPTFGPAIIVAGRPDGSRPFVVDSSIDADGTLRVRIDDPDRPHFWAEVRVNLAGLPWYRTETESDER